MQLIRITFILFFILASFNGFAAEENRSDAEKNFSQGQIYYENDEIDEAIIVDTTCSYRH